MSKIVKLSIFFSIYLLLNSEVLLLAQQETLPTFHWAYDYIDQLWLRGYFQELFILNKPFTRGQIANSLNKINKELDAGIHTPTVYDQWLIEKLNDEFRDEIVDQGQESSQKRVVLGSYLKENLSFAQNDFVDHSSLRSRVVFNISPNFSIFNAFTFDNRLDNDSLYIGVRQSGFTAFTEQAYARFRWNNFGASLGRDIIRWGAGQSSSLLLSDNSRPMDLVQFSYTLKNIKFTFLTAMLDAFDVPDTTGGITRLVSANRYLSAHRLDLRIAKWFSFSISELILYGGIDRSIEFTYLNPFIFYHGNLLNGPGAGNTLGTIDWYILPHRNIGVYGTIMIDDIQLEHSAVDDLEPNELGFLLGAKYADFAGIKGSNALAEYTRVTNRTYNSTESHEKFLHRNFPLGHFLGNDFDRWHFQWSQWIHTGLEFTAGYEHIRKGEGDIYAPFDTPWRAFSLEEGYSEPFPTGIVETTRKLSFKILYHPVRNIRISLNTQVWFVDNLSHIKPQDDNGWSMQFRIWFAPEFRIPLQF